MNAIIENNGNKLYVLNGIKIVIVILIKGIINSSIILNSKQNLLLSS